MYEDYIEREKAMYKVGICGHFALGQELVNGQIDKTKAVYKALAKVFGENQISILDTRGWKKNPVKMFMGCRKLLQECEHVIMMPSRNGFKVFPLVFELLNKGLNRKLHYVVVGGWLAERLENNPKLIPPIKKLDKIYVELEPMRDALIRLGVENAVYMPNLRKTNALTADELVYSTHEPYKLCTFSRILREKGIEEAVYAVTQANQALGRTAFTLDIYGKTEPWYQERFDEVCKGFEPYIEYKGFVNTDNSTQLLKNYFALLFPTFCEGEGFAGTIVDAFAAGIPVLATDWHYNSYIIRNGIDGLVYDPEKPELLAKILIEAAKKPDMLNSMKTACLERASHFEADKAVKTLLNELKSESEVQHI